MEAPRRADLFPLAGGNRQALAPFGPTTFEYQATVFRAHAHDEPMRAATVADVWLKSSLHRKPKCYRTGEKPVNVRPACSRVFGGPFSGREAYARVTSPETLVKQSRSGPEFSTGVEKTVENRGFLISQA
jgi:hypothetical protein